MIFINLCHRKNGSIHRTVITSHFLVNSTQKYQKNVIFSILKSNFFKNVTRQNNFTSRFAFSDKRFIKIIFLSDLWYKESLNLSDSIINA